MRGLWIPRISDSIFFPVNCTLIERATVLLVPDWPLLCKLHEIWSDDSQENHSNFCLQVSHFKAEMHLIRFRLGALPHADPTGGAYSAPPDGQPPSCISRVILLRGGERREKKRSESRGKRGGWRRGKVGERRGRHWHSPPNDLLKWRYCPRAQ